MVEFKRVSGYPWDTANVYLSQTSKACAALLVEPGEYILTDYTQTSVYGSIRTTAFLKRVTPKKFSIKGNGIYYLGTIRTKFGDLIVESEKEDKDFCIKQFNVEHPEVDWTQSNDLTMSKHYE
ncbi:hypothetical protein DLM75_04000 [Leptospira stimsonii]|uniref:Uncharacterized protein n=2 Tax=Leptospira stimsonii TaxID=2202203 RepID=A0A396ZF21_9LEPT|nr:hypothetical protein DLM75_04000 [Leptospira stimsonii]